ncbi:hypothetical protein B0H11DRAFT_484486 [Mycena galericulata]|nr:hypothetical protein B0H11DRAFT_484486 [Mycena galericulata]
MAPFLQRAFIPVFLVSILFIGAQAYPSSLDRREFFARQDNGNSSSAPTSSSTGTPTTSSTSVASPTTPAAPAITPFVPCAKLSALVPDNTDNSCVNFLTTQSSTINATLFVNLNQDLNTGCTNLETGLAYCLVPATEESLPTTRAERSASVPDATIQDCGAYSTASDGDTCVSMGMDHIATLLAFTQMNPDVGSQCDFIVPGTTYCVTPLANASVVDPTFLKSNSTSG